jgi:hypothetical protein
VWSLVRIQSPRLKKRLDNLTVVEPFSLLRLPIAAAVEHKWNMEGSVGRVSWSAFLSRRLYFFVSLQQNASL